ncbi:MAG: DNA replication and repair protein RecF [Treponema sp.]|nr:DNA replication and repair protein RecF [Treponema sp.]
MRTAAFRNLADAVVPTAAKNIFLVGENGQGKTNFLEALYFCAYAASFRGIRDSEIAQNGKKDFSAAITISGPVNILIKFENGKKAVFIDDKRVEDRKELLSVIPCIVFCHEDMEFVTGSPERQRWFFDQVLSLYDPVYLDDLRCYRRVLKSRNSVLRDNVLHRLNDSPETLLDALDQQCALYGTRLMEKRETAARLFSGIFAELYRNVSGIAGVTVQYVPSWKSFNGEETAEHLRKRRVTDLAAGNSLSGPHRDRYIFALGGVDFAGNASTGQRRLLALLLRVAQARRFSEMTGRSPILLLDDVLLEMDGEKRRRFIEVLPDYDQAFYTFLPEEPFQHYRGEDTLVYHVRDGVLEAEE